jgi:hypothetical protein
MIRPQLRWVLPAAQLLVCLVALWPARFHLMFGLQQAIQFYARAHQQTGQGSTQQLVIELPELTPERQRALDAGDESVARRMRVPLVLDFPVLIAQLPYVLVTRREWIPVGMFIATWRALFWPFAGLVFWWLAGRGIEALSASLHSLIHPRLRWIDVTWAVLFLVIGIGTFIGIVTSTPDDRRDKDFMALMYGGMLWAALAGLTIFARLRQWRILKRKPNPLA